MRPTQTARRGGAMLAWRREGEAESARPIAFATSRGTRRSLAGRTSPRRIALESSAIVEPAKGRCPCSASYRATLMAASR